MNAETPKPRTGDRVRVSFETTVASGAPNPYLVWINVEDGASGPGRMVCVPTYAVEVLERADDPSNDPEGTQRLVEYDCEPVRVFTASEGGAFDNRWVALNGATCSDEEIAGSKVVGAYPGTPAAEAGEYRERMAAECAHPCTGEPDCPADGHKFECHSLDDTPFDEQRQALTERRSVRVESTPHGPSDHLRRAVSEHLTAGDAKRAVDLLVLRTTMDRKTAARYIQDMPGYQTYLNHHGGTPGPRQFTPGSDGVLVPEPDDDIRAVSDKHGDLLYREHGGWIGEGGEGYPHIVKDWENHYLAKYAPYTEVV